MDIAKKAQELRQGLEKHFSPETAYSGISGDVPSCGHCAVVSVIVWKKYGGELVSAQVAGQSHWYNRIGGFDIDLTGDQFGFDAVQIKDEDTLYKDARIRKFKEANNETLLRAAKLAKKAKMDDLEKYFLWEATQSIVF